MQFYMSLTVCVYAEWCHVSVEAGVGTFVGLYLDGVICIHQ